MTDRARNPLEVLREVIAATAACTGQDFFDALVRQLACVLDACCAFVTEFNADKTRAQVRSLWHDGQLTRNFEYGLSGTPCERVLDGEIVAFSRDVQLLFPDDCEGLAALEAVSFLAIPLRRTNGAVRGHLAVTDKHERDWHATDFGVLEIFAMRTTAEMDREQHERSLEAANRELRTLKEAAETANRAKSEFLASMSHELRTPLNAVLGYAQLLKRDPVLGESQQREVAAIERGGEHLLALINDILDMAKIEAGRLELNSASFDLGEFLNAVSDMARVQALRKGLGFTYETRSLLPLRVLADERRLRQILLNLLGNAVKYSNEGTVCFRVRHTMGDEDEQRLHFEVEDSGIGIADTDLERIFERFTQARTVTGQISTGTGLGLTISRQLARAMGGDIRVSSEPGRGSLFSLHIVAPAAGRASVDSALPREKIGGYTGPRRRLLVVDDDVDNRTVLQSLLESMNFQVAVATNGREALESVSRERPDLVLMDLVMPVMDGFEAVRSLREDPAMQDLPVLAVSASVFGHTHAECVAAGFNGFLIKPVRFDEVVESVRVMLGLQWTAAIPSESRRCVRDGLAAVESGTLSSLHELARRGDVRALESLFDSPEVGGRLDPVLLLRMRELALAFDMKGIRNLLEQAGNTDG